MAVAAAEARIVGVHVGIGAAAGKAGAESEHAANRRLRTLEAAAVDVGEACIVGIDAYVLARAAGEGKMWRVESGSNGEGGKCRAANLPAPPERRRRNRASRPVCCHKQWSLLLHACSNPFKVAAHTALRVCVVEIGASPSQSPFHAFPRRGGRVAGSGRGRGELGRRDRRRATSFTRRDPRFAATKPTLF